MRARKARLIIGVLAVLLITGIGASVAARQDATGPVYNLEGAWYGITTFPGLPPFPTLDNFSSNQQKPNVEGSVLCTLPALRFGHPDHPGDAQFWLSMTPSGHGTWVRTGTNTVAYTAVRTLVDQNGLYFGRARNWGTFTALSDDEFTGTMTFQLYRANGSPAGQPLIGGVASSKRIAVIYEP